MVERQPTVDAIRRRIRAQCICQMPDLSEYGAMSEGHALLQTGSACRMLDECQALRGVLDIGSFNLFASQFAIAGAKQFALAAQRDVAEHLGGEFIVNHYDFSVEIGRYTGQSRAILGWLDLEVRIGEKSRHCTQHHCSDKDRHCRNSLRHNNDHAIAGTYTMIAQQSRLNTRTAAELAEGRGRTSVFIDPGGYERTIRRGRVERLNHIVKLLHAVVTEIRRRNDILNSP